MDTPKRLRAWINARQIACSAFARRAGCSPSYLAHMLAGRCRPGLSLAARIELITLGAVRAVDWVPPDELTIEAPAA